MKNKLPISAVIVCLNEEENIGCCIDSIIDIVDEVIVVDTHSTDNTVSIAEKHKAKVYNLPWNGYGKTKNKANSFAKNKWILSLDADEEVDQELSKHLQNLNLNNKNIIYTVNRLMYYEGQWIKHGRWYPDRVPRLFHSDSATWSEDFVHESLLHSSIVKNLSGHLNHYSYNSIEDHKNRIEKYAILKAKQWITSNKKPSFWKRNFGAYYKAFRSYILYAGFLDGKIGWQIAKMEYLQVKRELHHFDKLMKLA